MPNADQRDNETRIQAASPAAKAVPERYQASVVILQGKAAGMEYLLDRTRSVIGRDSGAKIPVTDPLVSREHAEILFHDGVYLLRDLGSTNGTLINGASIKQAPLRHGDTFRIGDTLFQFVLEDSGRNPTYEIPR